MAVSGRDFLQPASRGIAHATGNVFFPHQHQAISFCSILLSAVPAFLNEPIVSHRPMMTSEAFPSRRRAASGACAVTLDFSAHACCRASVSPALTVPWLVHPTGP